MNKGSTFRNIDEYHASFPAHVQKELEQLRQIIRKAAPGVTETISYNMPAFRKNKVLVYYAGNKEHIGFYPTPKPIVHFSGELEGYHTSKGAIQFPFGKPLPIALIKKIVKFRAEEDRKAAKPAEKKNAKSPGISRDILSYHTKQTRSDKAICDLLYREISNGLPRAESRVWHGHPVWFLNGNPIVGYSKEKRGMRLMFWSGADFDEPGLDVRGVRFKDASVFYNSVDEVNNKELKRLLKKAEKIQWDYKNIVKRKGVLERVK